MAYDHEEQEQLATIKAWWGKYGNLLTWLLIVALAAYAAWSGWTYHQRSQSAQAAQLYEEVQKALAANDNAKVQRSAADMQDKFGKTAYAQMSALAAAKSAWDAADSNAAKSQLQWLIDHGQDDAYKALAKIRLAGILLDEKAYGDGMKLLTTDFPPQFASIVADRKGDILVAQSKIEEARKAYQEALANSDEKDPARQLIQIKLDAIGGTAGVAAA